MKKISHKDAERVKMAKKIHKNVRALEPLDAVNKFLNLIGEENPADCFCGRKGIKKVRKNNK
ncbi:MAG: hypothetical protein EBW25_03235 [Actinobacteria bacterium]|nr:hypothetical protein [Actinomycetota bacterium]